MKCPNGKKRISSASGGCFDRPPSSRRVAALPMFRFAAWRPRNVLSVPPFAPSRIFTVLSRTLFDQLAFFLEENGRQTAPGSFFGPRNTAPSAALAAPPERSLASRRRPNELCVLRLVILGKSRTSRGQYWPNDGRFSVSVYFLLCTGQDVGVGSSRSCSRGSSRTVSRVAPSQTRSRRSSPRHFGEKLGVREGILAKWRPFQ